MSENVWGASNGYEPAAPPAFESVVAIAERVGVVPLGPGEARDGIAILVHTEAGDFDLFAVLSAVLDRIEEGTAP